MRSLSGIKPSGALHIGNYFGAIKQYIQMQDDHEGFYFIANYHALTTVRDRETLRDNCMEQAIGFLALGLDPAKSALFLQSDVPEVCELTWMLSTVTPMGLLERCHAYKDRISQGISADHGLFAYPVLMAADILIYNSDVVPVGQDQKQHVEVTRDIAEKLNATYGEILTLPRPIVLDQAAVVPGLDGRKMSKSYDNTILIFDEPSELKRKLMRIKTDSTPVEDPKDPEKCAVFALYRLFASDAEREAMAERYRKGGLGYGDAKKALLALVVEHFAEAREKRAELANSPDTVMDVLREGGKKARAVAIETVDRCRDAMGIL
ncbi:MAG TPA: tryptophan--tRNA ligase [Armatimonadota bacterium]|nr:tryptophan--tRNA ligase [Armatimonadota bacterium]